MSALQETHVQELSWADGERLRIRPRERQRLRLFCPHLLKCMPCSFSGGAPDPGQDEGGPTTAMTGHRRAS